MENLEKALELHFLPESMAWCDGVKVRTTQKLIIEKRTRDFTKKGAPVIDTYEVRYKDITGSAGSPYALSQIRSLVHDPHNELTEHEEGWFSITRPRRIWSPNAGPFAGMEFWNPSMNVTIRPTTGGCEIHFVGEPWLNTTSTGTPETSGGVNPRISIIREEWAITKAGQPARFMNATSYPVYTQSEFLAKSGMSLGEIAEARSYTYIYEKRDSSKFVNNTSADITVNADGQLSGMYFINGVPYNELPNYRSLKVNYMVNRQLANHPAFVERWVLDNQGEPTIPGSFNAFGMAWKIQRTPGTLPHITVVAGSGASLDGDELTFNENTPAILWYQTEEMPAQGKNWGAECYRDLRAGVNTATARGLN